MGQGLTAPTKNIVHKAEEGLTSKIDSSFRIQPSRYSLVSKLLSGWKHIDRSAEKIEKGIKKVTPYLVQYKRHLNFFENFGGKF